HTIFSRDWSSDVCSSDLNSTVLTGDYSTGLLLCDDFLREIGTAKNTNAVIRQLLLQNLTHQGETLRLNPFRRTYHNRVSFKKRRSEERRVGKGGRSEDSP